MDQMLAAQGPMDRHFLKDMLTACEGAVCEVMSMDNYFYFAGHIARRDPDFKVVTIEPRGYREAPLGVRHGTPVKVQTRVREQWGNLIMLYGTVSLCQEDQWDVFVQNAVTCKESRRAFRQRVSVRAQMFYGEDLSLCGKCKLEDISLVGVAFYSSVKLEEGQQLLLEIPFLTRNGPSYRFACTVKVVRNTSRSSSTTPSWRYGCSFDTLERRVESMLYKDIMALQIRDRNR